MDEEKNCVTTKKIINNKVFNANISKRRIRHSKKKEGYQEQLDRIIEGYAQEIRELRKKRSQSVEKPNQKTGDGQPEFEEIPNINNNNDQANTGHVYTKDSEKKKTGERKAGEDLMAAKWKNQMIVRYTTRTDRSLNTEEVRTTRREESNDYG